MKIGGNVATTTPRKRQRMWSTSRVSSTAAVVMDSSHPDGTLIEETSGGRRANKPLAPIPSSSAACGRFNESSTADVILRLYLEIPAAFDSDDSSVVDSANQSDLQVYLHSDVLRRSKYFSALLSDRWNTDPSNIDCGSSQRIRRLSLGISSSLGSIDTHLTVLQLIYTNDFSSLINSVSMALSVIPVALELLFEECVSYCVHFLEAVPWSEEEERIVLNLVPLLREEESQELLARVSPEKMKSSEEMLHGLILAAIHNQPSMASAKVFVAKLLRDFSSREAVERVLDKAFQRSLKIVKEALEEYSSPNLRGDNNETEAMQRLNLQTATTNGKHLLWLIERMIELRVADTAVKEWSDQSSFTADLQRAFRDGALSNIGPGLPAVVLRCTSKLSNAVATGTILAARQVRMKLVKDWLPVLIACRDHIPPLLPSHKAVCLELEETFLKIISTLPMSDSQELLQQCISFSTRNVEDCPHLVAAFNTWFCRANRRPPPSTAKHGC